MKRSRRGFTLVELLVVIAIIAIIAAVAVPVTIAQIDKAKRGAAIEEATNVRSTIINAIADYGLSSDLSADNLALDINNNFPKMEQCTDIVVTKEDKTIYFYVITKAEVKKDNVVQGYIAKNPELSDSGTKYVTVLYTIPGDGIVFTDPSNKIHIKWTGGKWQDAKPKTPVTPVEPVEPVEPEVTT